MVRNRLFDQASLLWVEDTGILGHAGFRLLFADRIRECQPLPYSTQPRSSPGNHVPYVGHVRKKGEGFGHRGFVRSVHSCMLLTLTRRASEELTSLACASG